MMTMMIRGSRNNWLAVVLVLPRSREQDSGAEWWQSAGYTPAARRPATATQALWSNGRPGAHQANARPPSLSAGVLQQAGRDGAGPLDRLQEEQLERRGGDGWPTGAGECQASSGRHAAGGGDVEQSESRPRKRRA